ncbi:MAG: YqiJ family protein [Desulfofustis sp. PB-SRB1]|jgi:hypothetical protein|nr:YqiJ family protein [Desulfofustis sp. PB-SRB1]MBM1001192.1 YqiJ family protein [Desulfofustis sp. PB-SRB1]HBH28697.1 DUF1449 domain-containing protein [Desulfofustis sp.]HBH31929.1 DUF1449 domain-containing protein [Desulfofustis sp.]
MVDFLLAPQNSPFTIALAVMLLFALLEAISVSLGMGLSEMLDSVMPDIDADVDIDVDVDADIDVAAVHGPGDTLIKLLSWFRIGEVPVLILFVVFLTGFGLSGLIAQFTAVKLIGVPMPTVFAVVIAMACAIPAVRIGGGFLGRHLPKDETYVVSEKSFVGQVATITTGTARYDKPAQAKLRDKHGQTHYILALADQQNDEFSTGESVIIVSQNGTMFRVIADSSSSLMDT